jgi:hypothetical protein
MHVGSCQDDLNIKDNRQSRAHLPQKPSSHLAHMFQFAKNVFFPLVIQFTGKTLLQKVLFIDELKIGVMFLCKKILLFCPLISCAEKENFSQCFIAGRRSEAVFFKRKKKFCQLLKRILHQSCASPLF